MDQAHFVKNKQKGFITLLSVMVLGTIAVAVAISLLVLGADAARTSLVFEQSGGARALADACAEEGLQLLRGNLSFAGNGSLALASGTCSYGVTGAGQNHTVNASGTLGVAIQKVQIIIDKVTPAIHIASWQDVAD